MFRFLKLTAFLLILGCPGWVRASESAGQIKSVAPEQNQFTLELRPGERHIFHVSTITKIQVNGKKAALGDLMAGDQAVVQHEKAKSELATEVFVTRKPSVPLPRAAITTTADSVSGEITDANADGRTLKLRGPADKTWTFQVSAEAKIRINNRPARLDELRAGDGATIDYVRDADSMTARSVTVTRKAAP